MIERLTGSGRGGIPAVAVWNGIWSLLEPPGQWTGHYLLFVGHCFLIANVLLNPFPVQGAVLWHQPFRVGPISLSTPCLPLLPPHSSRMGPPARQQHSLATLPGTSTSHVALPVLLPGLEGSRNPAQVCQLSTGPAILLPWPGWNIHNYLSVWGLKSINTQ